MNSLRSYYFKETFVVAIVAVLLSCGCEQETITHYEDGSIKSKCVINENGDTIGGYTFFSGTGILLISGEFDSKGERSGIWIEQDTMDLTRIESSYLNGQKHGIETAYQVGKKKYTGTYEKGLKEGEWLYYLDMKLVFVEYYEDGKRVKVENLHDVGN